MSTIIVDENIALGTEAFSGLGKVELLPGRKINRQSLSGAEALIVRSITKVNEDLLRGTPVKFVGTATIGTDHIDTGYLASAGIKFADAKGCNADAVTEYVFAAIFDILSLKKINLTDRAMTIGIGGVGNIGSRVVKVSESIGIKVLKNDPPLQRSSGRNDFVPLEEILKADIITFHVPLNMEGIDKTFHLIDEKRLSGLKEGCILINSSRGPVVKNSSLKNILKKKKITAVLDVWEHEPSVDTELLENIEIGTPHIAGYSFEGKLNGTRMIYSALCKFLGAKDRKDEWLSLSHGINDKAIIFNEDLNITDSLNYIFKKVYDIRRDDAGLRNMIKLPSGEQGSFFDQLRKQYPLRRELSNYSVHLKKKNPELERILKAFRMKIEYI
ncbi:MAG TPA: 4-phosphoerythronate dehydrogenase [Ignavibacteriaceae bacterium]|nr:4-phosphoerythronate dehydrogenase [Ignavibacteriaceae bacterium]